MKIYDISMTIDEQMAVYHNNYTKRPKIIHDEGLVYESTITMGMHNGTHIDAPLHMIPKGDKMEVYSLADFIGACKVFDFSKLKNKITKDDLLKKDVNKGDFILFKTKNSFADQFHEDFTYLAKDGARYLQEMKIKGVGTDGLGIERSQPEHETHKILLSNHIMIVEGLRLKDIKEGIYTLFVLPLKIAGVEAAPARAILIED